jgi:hypothetical protein
MKRKTISGSPLAVGLISRLRVAMKRDGEEAISKQIGVSRHTLARAVGGMALHAGTRLLIETRLEEMR